MFSVSKILTLVAIVTAVWYGFRLVGRLDAARKRKVAEDQRKDQTTHARDQGPAKGDDGVVDLVRDERTGEYVAKDKRDDRV